MGVMEKKMEATTEGVGWSFLSRSPYVHQKDAILKVRAAENGTGMKTRMKKLNTPNPTPTHDQQKESTCMLS